MMNPVPDAIALALASTRPALIQKQHGIQWINDVKALIRTLRSKVPGFDAERFLTLTGYTEDHQRAWDIK